MITVYKWFGFPEWKALVMGTCSNMILAMIAIEILAHLLYYGLALYDSNSPASKLLAKIEKRFLDRIDSYFGI